MTSAAAIQVDHLAKTYKGLIVPAVDSISFTVEAGEIFGLLGPNGAGKTTTISILCGLIEKTAGEVTIQNLSIEKQIEEIKQRIGVVPQDIALYPTLTAFENLRYIGNMYGLKGELLRKRIEEYLTVFGLNHHSDKLINTFSGGMKRRINLIAGILHQPEILFLDEPTVGVDVQSRNVITEYLKKLNAEGMTIVYTSHLMDEAENLCSRIAIIDHGKIIANGTPYDLIREHNSSNLEELFLKLTGRKLRD